MTPNDPLAQAEREAREAFRARIDAWTDQDTQRPETESRLTLDAALDRYRAAILARVRFALNESRSVPLTTHSPPALRGAYKAGWRSHYEAFSAALDALAGES